MGCCQTKPIDPVKLQAQTSRKKNHKRLESLNTNDTDQLEEDQIFSYDLPLSTPHSS